MLTNYSIPGSWYSSGKEIPCWCYHHYHKTSPVAYILIHFTVYIHKTHFNMIHINHGIPSGLFPWGLPNKYGVHLPSMYTSCTSFALDTTLSVLKKRGQTEAHFVIFFSPFLICLGVLMSWVLCFQMHTVLSVKGQVLHPYVTTHSNCFVLSFTSIWNKWQNYWVLYFNI